jgi:hypothetical protein
MRYGEQTDGSGMAGVAWSFSLPGVERISKG